MASRLVKLSLEDVPARFRPPTTPRRRRKPGDPPAERSALELALAGQIRLVGLPTPIEEHPLAVVDIHGKPRRWRFDFAWPEQLVAVEVDGGAYSQGRHTRGKGFTADCEKASYAAIYGWRVLHVTAEHVTNGLAVLWIEQALDPATPR